MSKPHALQRRRVTKLRAGSKTFTPRPGGVIEHGSGASYRVDDNGSTIHRMLSEGEETERQIEKELSRLRANIKTVFAYKIGEDMRVDIGKFARGIDAQDLWAELQALPSNTGTARVIVLCQKLMRRQRQTT